MMLFTISGRAGGLQVISGDHLDLGEVQRALTALQDYEKILPLAISIVSESVYDGKRNHECKVLDMDDYVAGKHGLKRYDLVDYQGIIESTGVDAKDLRKLNPFGEDSSPSSDDSRAYN